LNNGLCGIDPAALGSLAVRLERTAADLEVQAGRANERPSRHSHWSAADSDTTRLSATGRRARTGAQYLGGRVAVVEAAEQLQHAGSLELGPCEVPLASDAVQNWIRRALEIWTGRADATFPLGRWVFGNLWINRVTQYLRGAHPIIDGTLQVPSIANGWLPGRATNAGYFRWISSPAVQPVGKRISFGLSVVSAVGDANIVWNHGNPIDAFAQEGAGYVGDEARLGFSGSTTAFCVAPKPVTGGVVVATGIVWAGAEVVDHWDEITETWNAAYCDAERGARAVQDMANESLGAGRDWTSSRGDHVVDSLGG
jgi:hypothetical protein